MQLEEGGIISEYLLAKRYEAVAEDSRRRNILYENYLEIVQRFFVSLRQHYERTEEATKAKHENKNIYIAEFENCAQQIGQIIKATSIYQIDCITEFRINRESIIDDACSSLTSKMSLYLKRQQNFKSRQQQVSSLKTEVTKIYLILKNDSNEAINFYNTKLMMNRAKKIMEKLEEIKQNEKNLCTIRDDIIENSNEFQSMLLRFRKKLLQNKYQILASIVEKSKHFRNCVIEITLFLFDCIGLRLGDFQNLLKNTEKQIMNSKKRKNKEETFDQAYAAATTSIAAYNKSIDTLEKTMQVMRTSLKRLSSEFKENIESNKNYLIENLNALYTIEENPSKEIIETLDLFQIFGNKLAEVSDKLYDCCGKLKILKNNVKKHADVTLSLLKVSYTRLKNPNDPGSNQLDLLYSQLSDEYLIEILLEVYRGFKDALTELKNHIGSKYMKKKKKVIEDSMEISHLDETVFMPKKRPCKTELWLWRDWRDKTEYYFEKSDDYIIEINKFLNRFKEVPEKNELKRYECILVGKKDDRGVLIVCENYLQFTSFSNSKKYTLAIPFLEINNVSLQVKIFQKVLNIETEKGELLFQKIADIDEAKLFLQQRIDNGNAMNVQVQLKKQVELLPEQIQFLKANKAKRDQMRIQPQNLNHIKTITIQDIKVDEVFDLIYSDKQFSLYGKPEQTFFAYISKKNKDFNFVTENWDHPGPEFYTQNPESKFHICPLFSTRVTSQEHPMPRIPFMPKTCSFKEVAKIFWVSDEELDYYGISYTSGVPFCQNFDARVLTRIRQKGENVELEFHAGMIFYKDFAMKGMIKTTSEKELFEGVIFTVSEIEKACKIYLARKSGSNDIRLEIEHNVKQNQAKEAKGDEKQGFKLKEMLSENKLLFLCLIIGFFLNTLLRMFIN